MDSPLDSFLVTFLEMVQQRETGYVQGPQARRLAERMGVQPAFVEALYVSARMRTLLVPAYRQGGRMHWQVSALGTALIKRHQGQPQAEPSTGSVSPSGAINSR